MRAPVRRPTPSSRRSRNRRRRRSDGPPGGSVRCRASTRIDRRDVATQVASRNKESVARSSIGPMSHAWFRSALLTGSGQAFWSLSVPPHSDESIDFESSSTDQLPTRYSCKRRYWPMLGARMRRFGSLTDRACFGLGIAQLNSASRPLQSIRGCFNLTPVYALQTPDNLPSTAGICPAHRSLGAADLV